VKLPSTWQPLSETRFKMDQALQNGKPHEYHGRKDNRRPRGIQERY